MNAFKERIANFIDCGDYKPDWIAFETTEDLVKLLSLKYKDPDFSHYAISDNRILEIDDNGFRWWCLGYVKEPESVNFVKWAGWKFRALLDGKNVELSNEVVSSCGDELVLKDGRIAKNLRE